MDFERYERRENKLLLPSPPPPLLYLPSFIAVTRRVGLEKHYVFCYDMFI